jgi:ferritin
VTAKESLNRDYGLLLGFLKGVSLRLRFSIALEILLLFSCGFILILLGTLFTLELRETFPYLPFLYGLMAIVSLCVLIFLGLWRVVFRPSLQRVARGLEEKFPHLSDDVTNSLLLFDQMRRGKGTEHLSEGLIAAQIRRTANQVSSIKPWQVVNFKKVLRHLRLLMPLMLVFTIVLLLDPNFLGRSLALILHPFSTLPMNETSLSVDPKGMTLLRGSPVVIKAQATGKVPERLTLALWPEDREVLHMAMQPEGKGRFMFRMDSAQFSFQYQAYDGRTASPVYNLQVIDPPDVGKLKLTLIPPDYSSLPKEVRVDGNIEALKGTVVNIDAQATKPVKEGKILLDQGNELLLEVKDDHLRGSLLVLNPEHYSIKLKDHLGFENSNPAKYQVRVMPDQYPEGEIIKPGQDLEILGDEVLPIIYTAKDDFGVTSVRLSYQMGGIERFILLRSGGNGRFLGPETFKWDLGSLSLTPGDRVIYSLEVWDNDSISGPKKGYSRSFTLSVKDERARVAKEGEEAQHIADALLDLLADQLETKKDQKALSKDMDEILKRVDKNLDRMKDRVERFDFEALRRNLESLKNRWFEEPKETVTQEIERLALLAEEIAKRARMNEVEALAREMRNRQRRLIDFMKEFKGPLTSEQLNAVAEELKKLRELISSVMEALGKMATRLPDEFINSQELSGLDFQNLFKDLEEMEKKLMAGDLAGALEAAQRALQALTEMMAALGRAGTMAGQSSFDRLQGEMSRQTGELEKILAEQKEILRETEGIDRETKRRIEEEVEKRLHQSLPQSKEKLEGLRQSLQAEQSDSIGDLEELLKGSKLERFSQLAKELEKELSDKPEVQELIRELREMNEKLIPGPEEMLAPENREKFPNLSSRQENLRERTESLRKTLEMLAQLFPGMDSEILNDLTEGADFMGKASGRLRAEDAPGSIPPEQEAIRRLSRSQQAMQQMAQQMAMRMQAMRWGYPLAYDPRPGWYYGPWVPMPTLPQPELNRPRERGYTGIDREEFDPPSKDAYQVPKIFREKILDAMKEGVPSSYKREVERYFRGLAE